MSKLSEALALNNFAVVAELTPPKGISVAAMLAPVASLKGKVQAFSVPDNEHARMRLSALACCRLVQEAGGEALLHLACRDKNRLALESELLGAAALGIENLLLVSGDYVTLGDHPDAKPVYDADSVQLLQIAGGLMAGRDSTGQALDGSPSFFLGAVVIPEAEPWGPQLVKFEKKLAAGAQFFITPPVFDLEKLKSFRQQTTASAAKLLAAVKVLSPEEAAQAKTGEWRKVYAIPPDLLARFEGKDGNDFFQAGAELAGNLVGRIKDEKLADGIYLKAEGRPDLLGKILEVAGMC
ncbi:MAG: methylenetetrahydrofolate reductase [Deltaproteobacteria bacterium]|nr:methylenetetrahydrofolate reductase [Deltaproteobacteria bacterium]